MTTPMSWFIGYTPTYVTGVWMGNPEKKENLGNYMTGGHGAVPYFTSFMVPFMKDKPRDNFYKTPEMPAELKAANEQRKRDELEKLEKADDEGRRLGMIYNTGPRHSKTGDYIPKSNGGGDSIIVNPNTTTGGGEDDPPPILNTKPNGSEPTKTPVDFKTYGNPEKGGTAEGREEARRQ